MNSKFKIGDMGFTRGSSWLNKMTLRIGGKGSKASHAIKFYDEKQIIQALIKTGVSLWDWEVFKVELLKKDNNYCILTRVKPYLTREEEIREQTWMDSMLEWGYSKTELVLTFLDAVLSNTFKRNIFFFKKFGDLNQAKVICSKVANRPEVKLGYLPREAYYWTPEETYKYLISSGHWEVAEASPNW